MGSVLRDFQQHWLNETFLVQGFTMMTLTASCAKFLNSLPDLFPACILPGISDAFLC